jgi:glucose-1-phosphatase
MNFTKDFLYFWIMEITNKISAIVFDLGNVVLNIYPEQTEEAFNDLGLFDFKKYYTLASQTDVFDLLETGKISPKQFYNNLRQITRLDFTDEQIEYAWNQIIGYYPKANIDFLKIINKHYPIYLLSNTNAIHYPVYTNMLADKFGITGLEVLFTSCFFSHKLGLRKPNLDIYDYVSKSINIPPNEVLFLDDSEANIKDAAIYGWQTILYRHKNIEESLKGIIKIVG